MFMCHSENFCGTKQFTPLKKFLSLARTENFLGATLTVAQLESPQIWRKKNVCKGSHVAICGANSINWILTFFAVQKLGAIAVLVNFNLCAREIAALINYTDITHFCYGEMFASLDELKNFCGKKFKHFTPSATT